MELGQDADLHYTHALPVPPTSISVAVVPRPKSGISVSVFLGYGAIGVKKEPASLLG